MCALAKHWTDVPALGVGVVYWPQLDPLLTGATGLVDVLEIEPQAFWYEQRGPGGPLRCDSRIIDRLQSLPQHKIVHSVGCPIGGSLPPVGYSPIQSSLSFFQCLTAVVYSLPMKGLSRWRCDAEVGV